MRATSKVGIRLAWSAAGLGLLFVVTPSVWLPVYWVQQFGGYVFIAAALGVCSAIAYALIGARRLVAVLSAAAAAAANVLILVLDVFKMLRTPGGTW
jgi:hypothetical protein